MSYLASAALAREQSQGNSIVAQEVFIITLRILDAINDQQLSTVISATTTVVVNGITITGSIMTGNNETGASYYSVWKETAVDNNKSEQMSEVISYFRNLGYSIVRKSTTGTEFYWEIMW